jgi:hypothetical protein
MRAVPLAAIAAALAAVACKETTDPHAADLDVVRQATAAFVSTAAAANAGYTEDLTPCMADSAQGAMGIHVGAPARIDATVELASPEVIMYEPTAAGGRAMVGVEYLVPFTAWSDTAPPMLMGQRFKRNETFQVWALHAWVHRANPAGVFADWNATVTCANAPAPSPARAMAH